jgi:hypothetical protein
MSERMKGVCLLCGDTFKWARFQLGYKLCLDCGDDAAHKVKHTIAPLNKSNYVYISDMQMLKQLNPKRTT